MVLMTLKNFSADKTLLLLDLYHGCILEIRCVQEGKDLSVAKFDRMNYYFSLFSDWYFKARENISFS